MLLCGGDSFGRFSTPMGNGKQQEGYSAVELLIDKLNITGKEIAWPGASIDATVAKTIDYITKDNSIKFLIFYITANVRIILLKQQMIIILRTADTMILIFLMTKRFSMFILTMVKDIHLMLLSISYINLLIKNTMIDMHT